MNKQQIELSITIHAPIRSVWEAITHPAKIQQWFSPETPWVLTALEPGGKLYAVGYESEAGIIEVVEKPTLFQYRWDSPKDKPEKLSTITTYRLSEENDATKILFTETLSDTFPEAERKQRIKATEDGYKRGLANLQAYLEGRELPYPEGL